MDELTFALDLQHQHQLPSLVSGLAIEKRFAVCIIMHDIGLAIQCVERVILLKAVKMFVKGNVLTTLNVDHVAEVFEVPQEVLALSGRLAAS